MTPRNEKSGGKVAGQIGAPTGKLAKTDARYWAGKLIHEGGTRDGRRVVSPEFSARMQHLGRRETFALGTSNRTAAAARAKEVYLSLNAAGWEETLARFKPGMIAPAAGSEIATVGQFLLDVTAKSSGRVRTLAGYARCLRKIVADLHGLDGGTAKFDHRQGGRDRWLEKVHAVSLATLTPEAVQGWKLAFLRKAGTSPVRRREAQTSANTFLRGARSLFSPKALKFVTVKLPDPAPFKSVEFEPRGAMRYTSEINAAELLRSAREELFPTRAEVFKAFVLAVAVGLRRAEIDGLRWGDVDFQRGVVRIRQSDTFAGKSQDSLGEVDIEDEVVAVLSGFRPRATTPFVLESPNEARPGTRSAHYRCENTFKDLIAWLRVKGVRGRKPIHTLRKEFGALMASEHGIYVASRALRHADIGITAQHYLDKKRRAVVGLGKVFRETADDAKVVAFTPSAPPAAPEPKRQAGEGGR